MKRRYSTKVVLVCSAILVLILIALLWITFRASKPYLPAHAPDSIVSIEILHNKTPDAFTLESCHKIGELSKDEIPEFMHQLSGLEVLRVTNRHNRTGYGDYIAKVTYENGDVEMLGSRNIILIPNGEAYSSSLWDYFKGEAFTSILDQYVDISPYITAMQQLPEEVERIEILDTRLGRNKVLYIVEGDEILPFLSGLNELKFYEAEPEREETQTQEPDYPDYIDYLPPSSNGPFEWVIWAMSLPYLLSRDDADPDIDYEPAAPLTLRVCYQDGYYDLLSTVPSSYHKPDGSKVKTETRYYLSDGNALLPLLEEYLGEENMPYVKYDS